MNKDKWEQDIIEKMNTLCVHLYKQYENYEKFKNKEISQLYDNFYWKKRSLFEKTKRARNWYNKSKTLENSIILQERFHNFLSAVVNYIGEIQDIKSKYKLNYHQEEVEFGALMTINEISELFNVTNKQWRKNLIKEYQDWKKEHPDD